MKRTLTPVISHELKNYTMLDLRDYAVLLHLQEEFRVVEITAEPGSWLTKDKLGVLGLDKEGVVVLGIVRHTQEYIGTPEPSHRIEGGDSAVWTGRAD